MSGIAPWLCEATREDVQTLMRESGGQWWFCPICGKPPSAHPAAVSVPVEPEEGNP